MNLGWLAGWLAEGRGGARVFWWRGSSRHDLRGTTFGVPGVCTVVGSRVGAGVGDGTGVDAGVGIGME